MSVGVDDLSHMTFEEPIQVKINTLLQIMSIDNVEREILRVYYLHIDWSDILFLNRETCQTRFSLDNNYLCKINCKKINTSNSDDLDTQYEVLVTWPRDGRQERWRLIARRKYNSLEKFIYSFVYESLASPEVAADQNPPVTPEDERLILTENFEKMDACEKILSTWFRNETFDIPCHWQGKILCKLHCKEEDITSTRPYDYDPNHPEMPAGDLTTTYKLVVMWMRDGRKEHWTLVVSWTKGKKIKSFRYEPGLVENLEQLKSLTTDPVETVIDVQVVTISEDYELKRRTMDVQPSETVKTFLQRLHPGIVQFGHGFVNHERPINMTWVNPQEMMQEKIQNFWDTKRDINDQYLIVLFYFTDEKYKRELKQIQEAWREIAAVQKWSGLPS